MRQNCRFVHLFGAFIVLIFSVRIIAQEHVKPPFVLKDFNISVVNPNERKAVLRLTVEPATSGEVEVGLMLPKEVRLTSGLLRNPEGRVHKGVFITKVWQLTIPEKGYYLIEVGLSFSPVEQKDQSEFARYHSFPIYVEIDGGKIINFGFSQDSQYTQPINEDQREPKEKKPGAIPVPFDSIRIDSTSLQQRGIINLMKTSSTYNITVQISGRIRHASDLKIIKGVPDVGVYLDWDYDNNPNTGYTPYYGGNTRHVDYDKTDNNGYYYFSFTFTVSQPANQYSPRIRVYANNANSSAFDGDLGNGAKFAVTYVIDISSATTYVYSNSANLDVDGYQGGALRHLYRARVFSINRLSFTPHTIRYYIRIGGDTFFCQSGNCGGQNMSVPRIVFGRHPDSETGYHEYGHFIEYDKVGFLPSEPYDDDHWFRKQTEHITAWKEGWAEFYSAATHMYWYSAELPSQIEYGYKDYEPPYPRVYQFMDFSQGTLFTNRQNTAVEGAVACFFYSLWDGVERRAPNYAGDNDDLSYSGGFLLNQLANRYNVLGGLIGSTHIEAYRNALLNAFDSQNDASVNALYNAIINRNGSARPATPTVLQVSGSSNSRILNWNDNTCPNIVTFQMEGVGSYTFDLVENQEQGFRVYRKATNASRDGTLNGYTLVATVGPNITSCTDQSYLTGRHSYVVVAYNSSGNALPKAEFAITLTLPLSVTITGPTHLNSGEVGTFTANPSGGSGTYTNYQWWYRNDEDGPPEPLSDNNVSPSAPPYGVWIYMSQWEGEQTITMGHSFDFSLECKVTDSAGSTATDIHSVYVGGGPVQKRLADETQHMPTVFAVHPNYPNPFNPVTTIRYELLKDAHVSLAVYDLQGREVQRLVEGEQAVGYKQVEWNASSYSSGVYFYRLCVTQQGQVVLNKVGKMLVVKRVIELSIVSSSKKDKVGG